MTAPIEHIRMEANFEGLIQLLAQHLYPEPDVFVRELIQNAHDSIVRRREIEPDSVGEIAIVCDPEAKTITFRDTGIGMDRHDIRQFLTVIGSTGTGTARQHLREEGRQAAYDLIGQFGIGMLSAFVVATRVVVRTRKLGARAAFAWHNAGATTCELYADDRTEVGTEVIVSISDAYTYLLDGSRLQACIRRYCDFLPLPILLNGVGPVNAMHAPWHTKLWDAPDEREAACRLFVMERYGETPLDVIPLDLPSPYQAHGVLFIADRPLPGIATTGVIDLFVRRMFIRGEDAALLPPWARFVRGVIDSPDLQPTAARDNIQRSNLAADAIQQGIGDAIIARLSFLAEQRPAVFAQINRWHHTHLKGMAWTDETFFAAAGDLLLFETNRGLLSLRDYMAQATDTTASERTPLYYFAYDGSAAQFYRLADARGWTVINAGRVFEEELLTKYAERHATTMRLERLDVSDNPELFARLAPMDAIHFKGLELDVEQRLHRQGLHTVLVRMRRFLPSDMPALLLLSPDAEVAEQLRETLTQPWFLEGMDAIMREAVSNTKRPPVQLLLNANHPLVEALATRQRDDALLQDVLGGLYNSALLYAHKLLTRDNATVIHAQFVRALDRLVALYEETLRLRQELEDVRAGQRGDAYRRTDAA